MKIQSLIAQHVLHAHEGGNWTGNSVKEALKDVSLESAVSVTPGSANTISGLVHHLTYWNNIMVRRILGESPEIPEINGFDVEPLTSQEEWDRLKSLNIESAHLLASTILNFDCDDITKPILPGYSSAYKSLNGCVEHIYYHLGQITIIKNLSKHYNPIL